MATTPTYGWPRPTLTDPADIEVVGQALDHIDTALASFFRHETRNGSTAVNPATSETPTLLPSCTVTVPVRAGAPVLAVLQGWGRQYGTGQPGLRAGVEFSGAHTAAADSSPTVFAQWAAGDTVHVVGSCLRVVVPASSGNLTIRGMVWKAGSGSTNPELNYPRLDVLTLGHPL